LDYGCGSGILSIAALHMGAARCVGVDVETEALVASERNVHLNGLFKRLWLPAKWYRTLCVR
jgi:ribosomal protein L11 methyltransferase